MTALEFKTQYDRLATKFNTNFQKRYGKDTAKLFWGEIQMLPVSWFEFQVNMAIGDMKPLTLTILRDSAIRKRKEISQEQESKQIKKMKYSNNQNGLGRILDSMGVKSVTEAVEHKKKINNFNKGE